MILPTSVFQSREPAWASRVAPKWFKRCSASRTEVVWHGKWLVVTAALEPNLSVWSSPRSKPAPIAALWTRVQPG